VRKRIFQSITTVRGKPGYAQGLPWNVFRKTNSYASSRREQLTPIAKLQFSSSSLPHGKHNFFDRNIRRVKLEQHLHREQQGPFPKAHVPHSLRNWSSAHDFNTPGALMMLPILPRVRNILWSLFTSFLCISRGNITCNRIKVNVGLLCY